MSADNIEAAEASLPAGECVSCGTETDRWEHGELTSYHLCSACHAQALADLGQPASRDEALAALRAWGAS